MSYKALSALKEKMEIDFIKSLSPEEINKMFNSFNHKIEAFEKSINLCVEALDENLRLNDGEYSKQAVDWAHKELAQISKKAASTKTESY